MSTTELALAQRARDGDRAAFEELVRRSSRLVFTRLYMETGCPHQAEDLLQETMLSAFRSLHRLEDPAAFRPWLLTIAHRKAIDHHRSRGRTPLPSGSAEEVGGNRGAEDRALESTGQGEVWQLVSVLPPKQRSAVVLRFATDMAYAQIGDLLRKHLAHVKTGVPGMAYLRLDPAAEWPAHLAIKVPQ